MVDAVIYVLPGNYGISAARCLDYCAAKRYNVVGVVPGDWPAVLRMLDQGLAEVIVVSSAEHLGETPGPRAEIVPKRLTVRGRRINSSPVRRWQPSRSAASRLPASPRRLSCDDG